MLYKYVLVFIGAAIPWIEVLAVVPLGIIWGLSPAIVMITAFIGNMVTLIPVVIAFDRLKLWYVRRRQKQDKPSKKSVRAVKLFQKYGVIGLAFLGPILLGTHIAAFIGMAMGARRQNMILWMGISIAIWVFAVGLLTSLGFNLFV
ncbi:small multi-drug export protein [Virgibacillus sp. MSJ-26]|uniref:small multi-drug export protein n=1 Tax=Virgibacillus sp. MSJ-26 TaxID=2841522 RepID=UPI001C0F5253|nr:small multi-drug export protein [Virgibacillus sp. MSJ-26]MBU5465987.1 small multi-drug export protein [Virgibacillus sp. MSJ-26]